MSFDVSRLKEAKYGNAIFFVDTVSVTSGRFVKVHSLDGSSGSGPTPEERVNAKKRGESIATSGEYPFIEDLGREAYTIELNAYFLEGRKMPDYIAARDAFLALVNSKEIGILQLPTFPKLAVLSGKVTTTFNNKEGGIERVSAVFYRAKDNVQPKAEEDTKTAVIEKASNAYNGMVLDFGNKFNTRKNMAPGIPPSYGVAKYVVEETENIFTNFVDSLTDIMSKGTALQADINSYTQKLNAYKNDIVRLLNAPGELAESTLAILTQLSGIFVSPMDAFNVQSALFDTFAIRYEDLIDLTEDRAQLNRNHKSSSELFRNGCLAQMCELGTQIDYNSTAEAIRARDLLSQKGDEQQNINGNQASSYITYQNMKSLLASSAIDLTQRIALLPFIRTVTLQRTLPLLVISHSLYGDASRYVDIYNRNPMKSNLYPPKTIEVLSE